MLSNVQWRQKIDNYLISFFIVVYGFICFFFTRFMSVTAIVACRFSVITLVSTKFRNLKLWSQTTCVHWSYSLWNKFHWRKFRSPFSLCRRFISRNNGTQELPYGLLQLCSFIKTSGTNLLLLVTGPIQSFLSAIIILPVMCVAWLHLSIRTWRRYFVFYGFK